MKARAKKGRGQTVAEYEAWAHGCRLEEALQQPVQRVLQAAWAVLLSVPTSDVDKELECCKDSSIFDIGFPDAADRDLRRPGWRQDEMLSDPRSPPAIFRFREAAFPRLKR